MPSIRKRVYGLIRTFSSPNQSADEAEGSGSEPPSPIDENAGGLTTTTTGSLGTPTPRSPPPTPSPAHQSFIQLYLSGRLKKAAHPEIYYGKTGVDLPNLHIEPLSREVCASYTGPNGGLTQVPSVKKQSIVNIANLDDELNISFDTESLLEGLRTPSPSRSITSSDLPPSLANSLHDRFDYKYDWEQCEDRAYGLSASLYECHPVTKVHAGNPVADVFGVLARKNNCILALADGVNWGDRARLAARCAIRGAIDHLDEQLFRTEKPATTTLDIFHVLLGAFHAAHQLIVQEHGLLTTLCVTFVCRLKNRPEWAVCSCNVGDSLCFIYSQKSGVREVTLGSHDIRQMRDMRDAGGALGPVDGVNPELQNLTCAMTVIEPNDLVFITSDGISDNFDPVVGKFCVIKQEVEKENQMTSPTADRKRSAPPILAVNGLGQVQAYPSQKKISAVEEDGRPLSPTLDAHLPRVEAHQRHELMLLRMEDLLRHGVTVGDGETQSAKQLCENLLNFATQLTMAKRRILEDPELYQGDVKLARADQRQRRRMVRQKIAEMPGKLDHATVVAYTVGVWEKKTEKKSEDEEELLSERTVLDSDETDPDSTPTGSRKKLDEILTESQPQTPEPTEDSQTFSAAPPPMSEDQLKSSDGIEIFPESSDGVELFPESSDGIDKFPESSDGIDKFPESSDGIDKFPESSDGIDKFPESSDGAEKIPELPKSPPPPLTSDLPTPWNTEGFLRSLDESVKMIDSSSQSSSVCSSLHESWRLDFKEGSTEKEITTECSEIEREASIDKEIGSAEVYAATVEESLESEDEVIEQLESCPLDREQDSNQDSVLEPLLDCDRPGSVDGVVFLSNLDSTAECRDILDMSEETDLTMDDVTTYQSVDWDLGNGGNSNYEEIERKSAQSSEGTDFVSDVSASLHSSEQQQYTNRKGSGNNIDCPTSAGSKRPSTVTAIDKDLCPPIQSPQNYAPPPCRHAASTSIMNESYYIATKDCSLFDAEITESKESDKKDTGPDKKTNGFARRFEKLENTLKRKKKHKRGSPTRHTVGVDAGWLRRLATAGKGSRKSVGSVSPENHDEKVKSPRKGFPLLPLAATGKALRDRLKGLGSPLRAVSEPKTVPESPKFTEEPQGSLTTRSLQVENGVNVRGFSTKPVSSENSRRSSSESPNNRNRCAGGKFGMVHSASETAIEGKRGDGVVSVNFTGGEQPAGKVKMRNRISSGSKVQSIV